MKAKRKFFEYEWTWLECLVGKTMIFDFREQGRAETKGASALRLQSLKLGFSRHTSSHPNGHTVCGMAHWPSKIWREMMMISVYLRSTVGYLCRASIPHW